MDFILEVLEVEARQLRMRIATGENVDDARKSRKNLNVVLATVLRD